MDGYISPISLNVERITQDIREQHEQNVLHAVMQCGINVDRDELIKALSYDRDQYQKGFDDGCAFAQTWISVNDRLPEEKQSVLVHYVDGWMPIAFLLDGKWYQSGGETSWLSVTHWMPLPEAPEKGEQDASVI